MSRFDTWPLARRDPVMARRAWAAIILTLSPILLYVAGTDVDGANPFTWLTRAAYFLFICFFTVNAVWLSFWFLRIGYSDRVAIQGAIPKKWEEREDQHIAFMQWWFFYPTLYLIGVVLVVYTVELAFREGWTMIHGAMLLLALGSFILARRLVKRGQGSAKQAWHERWHKTPYNRSVRRGKRS